jgi:hypothetical protein
MECRIESAWRYDDIKASKEGECGFAGVSLRVCVLEFAVADCRCRCR